MQVQRLDFRHLQQKDHDQPMVAALAHHIHSNQT
jgi:hypothetical protein